MYLSEEKLATINGGAITATWLNAISRSITTIYNIGVAIGSNISRLVYGRFCR